MKEPKFKRGDWVFCEFKLKQIKNTEDDRITSVTDGMTSHGSHDLSDRCFPLEMRVKTISDSFKYWSDKFHSLKFGGINYPDLSHKLISKWVDACENRNNDANIEVIMRSLDDWGKKICETVEDTRMIEVDGLQIFNRR